LNQHTGGASSPDRVGRRYLHDRRCDILSNNTDGPIGEGLDEEDVIQVLEVEAEFPVELMGWVHSALLQQAVLVLAWISNDRALSHH
jgi:hypothetical protein